MIFLIDGSNLVYRAIFTFPTFTDRNGNPTGGVYGFFNILKSYASRFTTNKFIVVWEGKNQWRKEFYPEYKQTRKEKDESVTKQFQDVLNIVNFTGLLQIRKDGYEADDVIAYLTTKIGRDIRIVSGDKDLLQLVERDRNIKILRQDAKEGLITFDEDTIRDKFGCSKVELPLYLAMVGDKSDNVIGIRGVGPAKALKILKEQEPMKCIENLYPSSYEIVKRNLELIALPGSRRIKQLDPNDLIVNPPQLYALNQRLYSSDIRAFTASEIIDLLYDPDFILKTTEFLTNNELEIV